MGERDRARRSIWTRVLRAGRHRAAHDAAAAPGRRRAPRRGAEPLRIGIARDKAFGFYYPDDLAALEAAGAELVPIDTLRDAQLPRARRPVHRRRLPRAVHGRAGGQRRRCAPQLRRAIEDGLPIYAECGGLMYLARTLNWNGRSAQMVGAIPGDVVMHERPVGPRLRAAARRRPTSRGRARPASRCCAWATSSTTPASRTSTRRCASPTACSAATASTAGTTACACTTCWPRTPTCATPAATTGRAASWPSCARCSARGAAPLRQARGRSQPEERAWSTR